MRNSAFDAGIPLSIFLRLKVMKFITATLRKNRQISFMIPQIQSLKTINAVLDIEKIDIGRSRFIPTQSGDYDERG